MTKIMIQISLPNHMIHAAQKTRVFISKGFIGISTHTVQKSSTQSLDLIHTLNTVCLVLPSSYPRSPTPCVSSEAVVMAMGSTYIYYLLKLNFNENT